MTPHELAQIRSWDARCGEVESTFFPVTIDRRRLLEYVDELRAEVALSTLPLRQELTMDAERLPSPAEATARPRPRRTHDAESVALMIRRGRSTIAAYLANQ
jgi:hypothetical protein